MKLEKKTRVMVGFLVTGDGELGIYYTLEECEKAIQGEMKTYYVNRKCFHIYMYSETKTEILPIIKV